MDIELVETETLIVEVMKRFDHAILYGTTMAIDGKTMNDRWQYVGNARMCRGLTLDMMDRLNNVLHAKEKQL